MNDEQTVSITQACALVGVSRRTIYNWLNAGKLQFRRTAGGCIRIYPSSLWRDDVSRGTTNNAEMSKAPPSV